MAQERNAGLRTQLGATRFACATTSGPTESTRAGFRLGTLSFGFEDRLGESSDAIGVHLSSQGFKENEATMLLALLAFNLNTICRNELEDAVGDCWDMQRFVNFMLKVGG
ncbi:hypothetical protein K227x_54590 [Rubripirellula lacrimiformis]|uniref:Uncharacterized protein n=1 Tax=Rubripirellula lacrimiformis TaxID=1930273 RepID=A0A517NIS8_9BACT|nr:hypothetical protein K227x_54590 [Rubripirellula lacrimiformis]